jgi:6-phospho-3-hexuloisomerase
MSYLLEVCKELTTNAALIREEEISTAVRLILDANRLFVAGAGRSGFVARAFSNRLMHLGKTVYFVGEPTTPAIQAGDLLIILSGSGETDSLKAMAAKAKKLGVQILLLTIHPESSIGKLASASIIIPGATPKSELEQTCRTIQPMGNAFEQMAWLICDVMIKYLMDDLHKTEEEMFALHANLE